MSIAEVSGRRISVPGGAGWAAAGRVPGVKELVAADGPGQPSSVGHPDGANQDNGVVPRLAARQHLPHGQRRIPPR